jgi:hypothetical protein
MACAVVMTGLPGTTTPNGVACCAGSCCILLLSVFLYYLFKFSISLGIIFSSFEKRHETSGKLVEKPFPATIRGIQTQVPCRLMGRRCRSFNQN